MNPGDSRQLRRLIYQMIVAYGGAGDEATDHGTLSGLTDDDHTQYAKKASNLSDLASASTARTNLGLGGLAVQTTISNGDWSGDDLAVTNGGTGASTAAGALVNLGLTATASELNALDGITATVTELNYTDGVTSAIQTQLDAKQAKPAEGAFVDGDKTKLDGIETGADVTDTANVTSAGALMDSEVDADIKTLSLPASTTISAFGATLVDDADQATARTTLGVDAAGTDNSTDVTLAGTGTYLSLAGQEITVDPITESDVTDLDHDATSIQGVDVDATELASPSDGDILVYRSAGSDFVLEAKPVSSGAPAWGDITGTLSSQTDLQSALDAKTTLSAVYPVGCIYTSTVSTNPATVFGFGTWTAFGSGRVLVGHNSGDTDFDTVEETGGHKELEAHTHDEGTLATASDGAHTHTTGYRHLGTASGGVDRMNATSPNATITSSSNGDHTHTISGATGSTGTGDSGNLQPYIVVYFFKRTA